MSSLYAQYPFLPPLRAALAGQPLPSARASAWEGLLGAARRQGVAPFLLPHVARLRGAAAPPAAVLEEWRALYRLQVALQARREVQAAQILRALRQAGICCLPLKGLWLAACVYPEPGQRPMSDIDLLVQPERFEAAAAVLLSLGYAARGPLARTDFNRDVGFVHPDGVAPVELHWQMGSRTQELGPLPELRPLWQSAVAGRLGGEVCAWPAAEEHLALMAYHVVHHRFTLPLRAYLDLALLLRYFATEGLDAAAYHAALDHWHVQRAAPLLLLTAADLLGGRLTQPLAAVLPRDADWGRRQRAQAAAFVLDEAGREAVTAEGTWVEFLRRSRLARARLLWSRLWMPRAFMRQRHGAPGGGAGLAWAYLKRAWELAALNRGILLRLLRGDAALRRRLSLGEQRIALARWALGAE